jgi:hypothetical protein
MFKTIDVLIGFTLVMLVMSLVVTVVTQLISGWFNVRGYALKNGVTALLRIIDFNIDPVTAALMADHILRDPLVGQAGIGVGHRLAPVVHREELTKLLLAFGGSPTTYAQRPMSKNMSTDLLAKLRADFKVILASNGIADADQTLKAVRNRVMELEKAAPDLSNAQRMTQALLDHAASDFLAKLNGWFDQTIDRVNDTFNLRTRLVGFGVAIVVAVVLQLNALGVINHLSTDDVTRAQAVKLAVAEQSSGTKTAQDRLAELDLIPMPTSFESWWDAWPKLGAQAYAGIALSALLLSLGAPFWFEILKDVVKLRSVMAAKDDEQREQRQTTQSPAPVLP